MSTTSRRRAIANRGGFAAVAAAAITIGALASATGAAGGQAAKADRKLDRALVDFVETRGAPPGIAVVVQRRDDIELHSAGVRKLKNDAPIRIGNYLRVASVAKAFSGATSLSLVADGLLSLRSTIGEVLPQLPVAWHNITLRQLLRHTSGIPDFSLSEAFQEAVVASLDTPPPPIELLSYVANDPLLFVPGSEYRYSNSDNIVVGLMVEAVTGRHYQRELTQRVSNPLGLGRTSLPRGVNISSPAFRGYDVTEEPPEDVTELIAAGWSWASGGVIASPRDLTRFVRGYVTGATTDEETRKAQFNFIRGGSSEPPGPGTNSAGAAIFRYQTNCGTVFGHTGNTPGYTNFIAATRNGNRSATVSINAQITPKNAPEDFEDLRHIFKLAVCAATAGRG